MNVIQKPSDFSHMMLLPYDCVNLVFDYLAQMLDAKWCLVMDNKGRIHMRINKYASIYMEISDLHFYKKQIIGAKYITLRLFNHYPDELALEVQALEEPRILHSDETIKEDKTKGHIDFGWCYSYTNPLNDSREFIYTEARYYIATNHGTFLRGTLYRDGSPYNVTDYNMQESVGIVNIGIQSLNLDWDGGEEETDIDTDVAEAAEGLMLLYYGNNPIASYPTQ